MHAPVSSCFVAGCLHRTRTRLRQTMQRLQEILLLLFLEKNTTATAELHCANKAYSSAVLILFYFFLPFLLSFFLIFFVFRFASFVSCCHCRCCCFPVHSSKCKNIFYLLIRPKVTHSCRLHAERCCTLLSQAMLRLTQSLQVAVQLIQ